MISRHPPVIDLDTVREQRRLRDEQALIEAVEAELDQGSAGSMDELIARAKLRLARKP